TLQVEGTGEIDLLGPVKIRATVTRATLAVSIHLGLPAIPVGPDLVRRASRLCPELGSHAAGLTGQAEVQAEVQVRPDAPRPLTCQVAARLHDGRSEEHT